MNALVFMQPLDAKRQPLAKPMLAGTVPRDGQHHRISITLKGTTLKTFPHYVFVFADGDPKRGGVFACDVAPPEKLRALESVTLYQLIAVNPRTH